MRAAARCVPNGVGFCLARHRRISPSDRPEPRPSGVHPEEAEWKGWHAAPIIRVVKGLEERCGQTDGTMSRLLFLSQLNGGDLRSACHLKRVR